MRVVITGGTGFIGRAVVKHLLANGCEVLVLTRQKSVDFQSERVRAKTVETWTEAALLPVLRGANMVIHLAGRAHILNEDSKEPQKAFNQTNIELTRLLARVSVDVGVTRFIFASSIGVNGVANNGSKFTNADRPNPQTAYARSKLGAENLLLSPDFQALNSIIFRIPGVYAKGEMPGNFGRLLKVMNAGIPLPLASIKNSKSFVSLDNLARLFVAAIHGAHLPSGVYMVSDGRDLSTGEWLKHISRLNSINPRLFAAPEFLVGALIRICLGKTAFSSLMESLTVDISETLEAFEWRPR